MEFMHLTYFFIEFNFYSNARLGLKPLESINTGRQGVFRNLSGRGEGLELFSLQWREGGGGFRTLWGPENSMKSIDFTGPQALAPLAPPP